jgi:predicted transcriptional regulator
MKFEWDVARNLLQAIEDSPRSRGEFDFSTLNLEAEALNYHLRLLMQRGLIEATEVHALEDSYPTCMVRSMTLDGHELLEVMRNDTMWGNIKSTVKEKGLGLTFDTIKAAGVWLIHRAFS